MASSAPSRAECGEWSLDETSDMHNASSFPARLKDAAQEAIS
eukprot:CAMPEP_0181195620 /NCGR_PEP_ID=MMETSP1096-20121128/14992_1 /TAXON_ID=156174 ORGANISM="Chrysochromulina ericina, Strain CCMP281" /NCGR_SAMPLE_ID=MMETSP1096 /ASSEMBLY_ACC=CAM_ASM_000453 /LENGTH=41 /DNA_ID= /DNA_START= /DNA_END= /DNA_ORIENTATION=